MGEAALSERSKAAIDLAEMVADLARWGAQPGALIRAAAGDLEVLRAAHFLVKGDPRRSRYAVPNALARAVLSEAADLVLRRQHS